MKLSKVITSVQFLFMRPFTLPNFTENLELLNQQFDFLSNSNDYSQYYKDLESLKGKGGRFKEPSIIPNLGPLMPLRKKHTLNSYWQSIRLLLKIQEKKGKIDNELFLLLPLKISIPKIKSVRVKNIKFPVNVYIYLFSFGSCCVNMEINVSPSLCNLLRTEEGFDELSDLINNLKGSTFDEKGSFEPFSLSVSRELNQVLFKNGKDVIPFPTHTLIFMETSELLIADFNQHKQAIAATMSRKTVNDVSTLTDEAMNKLIHCEIKKLRDGEIIFFSPMSTFIYPSPIWIGGLRQEKTKFNNKKLQCMYNNYRDFINTIFAVNRFLQDSFLENKVKLPSDRSLEIIKCFTTAYPDTSLNSSCKIYYGAAFKPIAQKIRLIDSLEKLEETV